jgi:hypothetical protein
MFQNVLLASMSTVLVFSSAAEPSADVTPVSQLSEPAAAAAADTPTPPASLLVGHTGADLELIEWVTGRYEQVGLDLPVLEIVIDAEHERCTGIDGVFIGRPQGSQIILCLEHRESFHFVLHRKRTLLHEFAHAWDYYNLTDDDRERLLPIIDAGSWYDDQPAWDQRGVERFAETMVWGLFDQLRRPAMIDVRCDELNRDFRVITGYPALGPIEVFCEIPNQISGPVN